MNAIELSSPLHLSQTVDKLLYTDPYIESDHTRNQYRSNLLAFDAWRGDQPITKTLVQAYAAHLQRTGMAPRTIKQKISSILWYSRKMVDFAFDYLSPEQAERVSKMAAGVLSINVSKVVKGNNPPAGRHIRWTELKRIIHTCVPDESPAGLRDAALFAVAAGTGIRNAGLRKLQLSDLIIEETLDESENVITESELLVHGKGKKIYPTNLPPGSLEMLQHWLEVRGSKAGPIFCHISKSGTIFPERGFSGEGLRKILLRRLQQSKTDHLTFHDFRRTLVGNLLDANVDINTVRDLVGHSSSSTTSAYDRRPKRTRLEAVRKVKIPTGD